MTEDEKQELLAAVAKLKPLHEAFLWALLSVGGAGVFMLLYSLTEVLPWRH